MREEEIHNLYVSAWKNKCKGITIYREGCRSGVLISNEDTKSDKPNNFIENNAPKRPKILDANVFQFINKGEKWIGVVGLLYNRPYEIFTGKWESFFIPPK